ASDASFASVECRLDGLVASARQATDLGRRAPRIVKQLDRAASATRDAETVCNQGRTRPARARLRRARKFVGAVKAMLAPRGRAGVGAAADLADAADAVAVDLKALRLQVQCPAS